jgi:hypothetical protein
LGRAITCHYAHWDRRPACPLLATALCLRFVRRASRRGRFRVRVMSARNPRALPSGYAPL